MKMKNNEWIAFKEFRKNFKIEVQSWNKDYGEGLREVQKILIKPDEDVRHSIVYNKALDAITIDNDIKLIIVADNPGYDEQYNKQYLFGEAGLIAKSFFIISYKELGYEINNNVLVLNKTPIFTPETKLLTKIPKNIRDKIQDFMAKQIAILLCSLECDLWIIGSGELKKGLFRKFKDTFSDCLKDKLCWNNVLVFQHFSRGCFYKDLGELNYTKGLLEQLKKIGKTNRIKIFGR